MGVLAKAAGSLWDWIEAGYPEEVAKRIVSGELPMDEASRLARAQEQGYGPVLYHGSTNPNLTEIAPMEVGKRNATGGNGLFLTDDPRVASTYAYDARVNGGTGPDGGTVYPLRVKDVSPSQRVTVKDRGHRGEEYSTYWDEIPTENIRGIDTYVDSDAGHYLQTDQINRSSNREGKKLVEYTNLMDSAEDVYEIGRTDVPSNVTAILDNTLVRSPSAAYDPQYTGSNIMGGLLAGGVGLGALSQSEDADASIAALARRGLKVIKNGDDYDLIDEATGDYAGKMTTEELLNGNMWSLDTKLNDAYRGQGIGNEYYDAVEEVSGKTMQPSPWLSMDGVRFWGRRDPEALADMVRNDEFYDGQNHEKVLGYLRDIEHPGFSHDVPGQVKLRGFRQNYAMPPLLAAGTGAAVLGAQPKAEAALKSEGLEKATGFLDETIRSARHAAGPLSFLVPYEGISNFAKKWNADEDLTWQDYLGLLDF
jgi:hypothetical protein